jgi:outer membrane protein
MKVFNKSTFFKILSLLCLTICTQVLHAQTEDSLRVETTPVSQSDTVRCEQKDTVSTSPVAKRTTPRVSKSLFFAQIRSKAILAKMPQYQAIQRNMDALREQYEAEARKSENDFQKKFEEFMQGHRDFPKTILEKRQNELQNMLETNAAFRIKVQNLLVEAEKSMMADVMSELNEAISVVAKEKNVSIVFDLDGGTVPYIIPGLALDLTSSVIEYLLIDESGE